MQRKDQRRRRQVLCKLQNWIRVCTVVGLRASLCIQLQRCQLLGRLIRLQRIHHVLEVSLHDL